MFNNTKIKILLAITISFLTVSLLSKEVFVADSPQINPLFLAKIKNAPSGFLALFRPQPSDKTDEVLGQIPQVTPPPGLLMKTVAKGVQAAEDPVTNKKYMTFEKGTKVEVRTYTYTENGEQKKITLIIPLEK